MIEPGIFLIALIGVLLAFFAPLELAFGAVLGAWMLIPAGLIIPGLHVLLVNRVILGVFVVRLLVKRGPGEPGREAFRLAPMHMAWGALLLVGYLDGVVLPSGSLHDNLIEWLTLVDVVAFFVVTLAVLRTIGPWRVLRPIVVVVAVASFIGIMERVTGRGWAAYLTEHVPDAYRSTFIFGLATRGGSVRSQAASEFALEFGWVLVMLFPLIAVAVTIWMRRNPAWRSRRSLLLLIPVGALIALVLTESRSAEIGVALALLILVVAAGFPRYLTRAVVISVSVAGAIALLAPGIVGSPFAAAAKTTSISSRLQRLPDLFALVVHHVLLGIGYTGYHSTLIGADDAYALTYSQLGVVGVLAYLTVIVSALAAAARALRGPRESATRTLGAAALVGVVAVAVASGAYDLTFTEQSMWTLALLSAFAVMLSEQVAPSAKRGHRSPLRALWPVAGAMAGLIVLVAAPVTWARQYTVFVITPKENAGATGANGLIANTLANTVCGFLALPELQVSGTTLHCEQPSQVETFVYPAEVSVRITGATAGAVESAQKRAFSGFNFSGVNYPLVAPNGPVTSGRPTWAVTAPLTCAVAGGLLALVTPPLPVRRRRLLALSAG